MLRWARRASDGRVRRTTYPPEAPIPAHRDLPLTELQQSYWVGQAGGLELAAKANKYFELEVTDRDLRRLEAALARVIERHELLRSVILPDGRWRIPDAAPPYRLETVDLRPLDPAAREQRIADARARMLEVAVPTGGWPLLEVLAHQIDDAVTRLHISGSLLVFDFAAWRILDREWEQAYRDAGREGAAPPTPAASYGDFLAAQEAARASDRHRRSLELVVQELLAAEARAPELPLRRLPAAVPRASFRHRRERFAPEVWAAFKRLAQRAGAAPPVALMAAYASAIAAWSRSPSFTITTLSGNRERPELAGLLGNTTSTMLVGVRATGSFRDRARAAMTAHFAALQHREVSGVAIARELNRALGRGVSPLFPIVYTHGGARDRPTFAWLGASVHEGLCTPQVWLDCQTIEEDGGLVLNLDAVEELFADGVCEELFAALAGLIRELAEGEAAWGGAPALTPARQLAQRAAVNATAAPVSDATLYDLFAAQAARRPDAIAVIDAALRELSYAELGARASAVAAQIARRGDPSRQIVGVLMEKGWEQVAATLGAVQAGAAYLPIHPQHTPRDRLRQILEDARVELVLTQSQLEARIEWPPAITRVAVDRLAPAAPPRLERPPRADDLAYVIYTSGSSGAPKGVMIDHRGAVNTVLDVNRRFGIGAGDRVLAISSLSFDLSVYDLFGTLAAGGAIVMPGQEQVHHPAEWPALLRRTGVTVWSSVPQLLELLVEAAGAEAAGADAAGAPPRPFPPALRLAMLSGDWIPVGLPDRLRALAPGAEVISLGGATEASIWSNYFRIDRVDPSWRSIPYGTPLANQSLHVLDDALRPRPVWVPGDLYIGGVGLALGYWGDAAKTAAAFLVHPETGERLYRTGDLGRYLPDGNVELLGRLDGQVKLGGHRIELGEIEAALARHPQIEESYLLVHGAAAGPAARGAARQLVAYYVADEELDAAALRAFLRAGLPAYMIPSFFIRLSAIPLSHNGKVDRGALPPPQGPIERRTDEDEAPRDDVERALLEIWKELLGLERIGVTAGFFDLGGTSLTAARLATRVAGAFGARLTMATLLQHQTLRELAGVLRAHRVVEDETLVALAPARSDPPLFLIHPVGGSALCYAALARRLGHGGRGVFALQAVPGVLARLETLEELAAHYLGAIRRVQPAGPYHLAGWSLGGSIAWEIARQLARDGEATAFLGLIDSFAPHGPAAPPADAATELAWFAADLGAIHGASFEATLREVQAAAEQGPESLARRLRAADVMPDLEVDQILQWLERFRKLARLARGYVPEGKVAHAALLRAAAAPGPAFRHHPALRDPRIDDPLLGWRDRIERVELRGVPGDHYTLVAEPNVEHLARELIDLLARSA